MSDTAASDKNVSTRLREVLISRLPHVPEDVDWSSVTLTSMGMDSMVAIELVLAIEDAFGAQFPEERLVRETFETLDSLEAVVKTMVKPS